MERSPLEGFHAPEEDFGAPLINARDWVPDAGFSDSHHMLPGGAITFTERLGSEALLPLLARAPNVRY